MTPTLWGRGGGVVQAGRREGAGPMKLGIYVNSQHPAGDDPAHRFAETLEQVRLIRQLGIPGISLDPAAPPEAQLRRLAADRFALGSPAPVAEALVRQHRAGVTHATMRVSWPGMPQDDT